MVVKFLTLSFLECCLVIGHFVVHVAQVTFAFHRTLCISAIAVPSSTLRTVFSATPFVSERRGCLYHDSIVNLLCTLCLAL